MTLDDLKKLAGIKPFTGLTPYQFEQGSNISVTANEKSQYMKKHNIQPGTPAWFRLWFARPYLSGEKPHD
jgi:hypothetical protein